MGSPSPSERLGQLKERVVIVGLSGPKVGFDLTVEHFLVVAGKV